MKRAASDQNGAIERTRHLLQRTAVVCGADKTYLGT